MKSLILAAATALGAAGCFVAVPAAAAPIPACGNNSLAVSATGTQGATGHGNFIVLFKNRTQQSCTIHGYPGLDALNAHGGVMAHATRTLNGFTGGSRHGVPTVLVRPGHFASADVEWMNFNPTNAHSCAFSHSVATTPANTSHTVHLARSVSVCRLQVHPTVAGKSGNG